MVGSIGALEGSDEALEGLDGYPGDPDARLEWGLMRLTWGIVGLN